MGILRSDTQHSNYYPTLVLIPNKLYGLLGSICLWGAWGSQNIVPVLIALQFSICQHCMAAAQRNQLCYVMGVITVVACSIWRDIAIFSGGGTNGDITMPLQTKVLCKTRNNERIKNTKLEKTVLFKNASCFRNYVISCLALNLFYLLWNSVLGITEARSYLVIYSYLFNSFLLTKQALQPYILRQMIKLHL